MDYISVIIENVMYFADHNTFCNLSITCKNSRQLSQSQLMYKNRIRAIVESKTYDYNFFENVGEVLSLKTDWRHIYRLLTFSPSSLYLTKNIISIQIAELLRIKYFNWFDSDIILSKAIANDDILTLQMLFKYIVEAETNYESIYQDIYKHLAPVIIMIIEPNKHNILELDEIQILIGRIHSRVNKEFLYMPLKTWIADDEFDLRTMKILINKISCFQHVVDYIAATCVRQNCYIILKMLYDANVYVHPLITEFHYFDYATSTYKLNDNIDTASSDSYSSDVDSVSYNSDVDSVSEDIDSVSEDIDSVNEDININKNTDLNGFISNVNDDVNANDDMNVNDDVNVNDGVDVNDGINVNDGVNVNDVMRPSLIGTAVNNNNLRIVELFLSDDKIRKLDTLPISIEYICLSGYYDMLVLLLNSKKIVPSVDNDIALRSSVTSGHIKLVKLLLSYPDVNLSSKDNYLICYSIKHDYTDIALSLLDDPRLKLDNDIIDRLITMADINRNDILIEKLKSMNCS